MDQVTPGWPLVFYYFFCFIPSLASIPTTNYCLLKPSTDFVTFKCFGMWRRNTCEEHVYVVQYPCNQLPTSMWWLLGHIRASTWEATHMHNNNNELSWTEHAQKCVKVVCVSVVFTHYTEVKVGQRSCCHLRVEKQRLTVTSGYVSWHQRPLQEYLHVFVINHSHVLPDSLCACLHTCVCASLVSGYY